MKTGNYVADYRVENIPCDFCGGNGVFYVYGQKAERRRRIRQIIQEFYDYNFVKTFSEIKSLWETLKYNGEVECPNCFGRGKVEVWR